MLCVSVCVVRMCMSNIIGLLMSLGADIVPMYSTWHAHQYPYSHPPMGPCLEAQKLIALS